MMLIRIYLSVRKSGRLHRYKLPPAIDTPGYLRDKELDDPRLAVDSFVVDLTSRHYRDVAVNPYHRFARLNHPGDRSQARRRPCLVGYDSIGQHMHVVIAQQL